MPSGAGQGGGETVPLKALDIYKLLPRKNCKECGDPTCLTFAMKLASGKGDVDRCPYLDEQARETLGSSTRPPIRLVKVGVGERSFSIGDELVQFRHEKTFYHPPGVMVAVSDLWTRDRIQEVVTRVRDTVVVRVGTDIRLSGVAIRHQSGDPAAFRRAVEAVEEVADLPEVLMAEDPAVMEQGLAVCGHFRPLIAAATEENYETMGKLANDYGCPLVVKAKDPGRLLTLWSAARAGECRTWCSIRPFCRSTSSRTFRPQYGSRRSPVPPPLWGTRSSLMQRQQGCRMQLSSPVSSGSRLSSWWRTRTRPASSRS